MQKKSDKPELDLGERQENFGHIAIYCCAILVKTRGLGRSNKKGHNSRSERGLGMGSRGNLQPEEVFGREAVDELNSGIPHICHGSHGYIRVNFFWPV